MIMGDTRPPRRPRAVKREAKNLVAFEVKITAAIGDTTNQPVCIYVPYNRRTHHFEYGVDGGMGGDRRGGWLRLDLTVLIEFVWASRCKRTKLLLLLGHSVDRWEGDVLLAMKHLRLLLRAGDGQGMHGKWG